MAKTGKDNEEFPLAGVIAARGRFQLKSWKGRPYVSKWPRRRGKKKTPLQQAWVNHFSCVAQISKIPHPRIFDVATNISKGTGWYYRDVLASAAVGKLYRLAGEVKVTTPTARVHRTAAQALTSGVDLALIPTVLDWDTNVFWSSSVNPTRLTFKSAGLYMYQSSCQFNSIAAGRRALGIRINGATYIDADSLAPGSAQTLILSASGIWYFHANDYIETLASSTVASVTALLNSFWVVAITPEAIV